MQRLRRFLIVLTVSTYLLISVGGLVRAAGAGLGCPDWPLCYGQLLPPTSVAGVPDDPDHPEWKEEYNATLAWTEYINRLFGIAVGIVAIIATVRVLRHAESSRALRRWTIAMMVLFVLQGGIGGLVVLAHLDAFKVTVHFLAAIVIACVLLHMNVLSFGATRRATMSTSDRRSLWALRIAMLATFSQIILGTRVRAGIDNAVGGSGEKKAPDEVASGLSRSEWLAQIPEVDLPHRQLGVLAFLIIAGVLIHLLRSVAPERRLVRKAAMATIGIAGAQILAGLALAYADFPAWAMVMHLSIATWLVGGLFLVGEGLKYEFPRGRE